jgi:hypothetical protein
MIAVLLAFLFSFEIASQAQYRERMERIDHSFAALRERQVKPESDVDKEATKLAQLFSEVESFWKGRGNEEAAGFARMAKEGARSAREAFRDGNDKALEAAVATIAASCQGCHKEPLDKYRFPRKVP